MFTKSWMVALLGFGVIAAGCGVITSQDAQETLDATRELRRIENEEIRPLIDAIDALEEAEIAPRELELETLSRTIRAAYRDKLQPIEDQMRSLRPEKGIEDEFEAQFRVLEVERRGIEERFHELDLAFREKERASRDENESVTRLKEDELQALHRRIQDAHRSPEGAVKELHEKLQAIHRQLGSLPHDSADADALRRETESLEAQIGLLHNNRMATTSTLEAQARAFEDELHALYRSLEDQGRAMRDQFEASMRAMEDDRSALEAKARELEERARSQMDGLHGGLEAQHLALEEQMEAIMSQEIGPSEDRIYALELEIDGFRDQERALQQQLRAVSDRVEPMKQQMEERLFQLLEDTLAPIASGATGETAPAE